MAGLLTDIGSVCNTFNSVSKLTTFGSDILSNTAQAVGLGDSNKYSKNDDQKGYNIQSSSLPDRNQKSTVVSDIRGLKQVFRDKKYYFHYDKDFKCYQDDFYFKTKGKDYRNILQEIQIYEFQPLHQSQLGTMLKQIVDATKTKSGAKQVADQVAKQFAAKIIGSKVMKNNYIADISKSPESFYINSGQFYDDKKYKTTGGTLVKGESLYNSTLFYSQISTIRTMFRNGIWLNRYFLPVFDQNIYNKMFYLSQNYSTWEQDGKQGQSDSGSLQPGKIENAFNQLMHTIMSPIAQAQNTLLKTPIWKPDQGSFNDQINIKLDLINQDLGGNVQNGWTFRNYRFMQNFITGTMPVSMVNSVMQSPNIYRVNIAGKCVYYWASIQATATASGKQRLMPDLVNFLKKQYNIKSLNPDKTMFPQVWKLDITIKNLMPMSFTTYANSLMSQNPVGDISYAVQDLTDNGALIYSGLLNKLTGSIQR